MDKEGEQFGEVNELKSVAAAAEIGDMNEVTVLLRKHGEPVNAPGGNHNVPALIYAASNGNSDLMSLLISSGADANCSDAFKTTPMHYCCRLGLTDIASRLIDEAGAAVNRQDVNGATPLHLAAHYGHLEAVQLLLSHGADPTIRNVFGKMPSDLLISSVHRRVGLLFDGTETLDDIVTFSFSEEYLRLHCKKPGSRIDFEMISHLADSPYLRNMQMVLKELQIGLSKVTK